jgi:hypothetical protein
MRRWCNVVLALILVLPSSALSSSTEEAPAAPLDTCQTIGTGSGYRWEARTDPDLPAGRHQVVRTSVAEMLTWAPLASATLSRADLPRQPGFEQQFSYVRGALQRVVVDPAGDLRLELADVDDPSAPRVVAVIPPSDTDSPFCSARQALVQAMPADPLEVGAGTAPVWLDLVGRPFYDGERCDPSAVASDYASPLADATCWEIHPIVQLTAVQPVAEAPAQPPQVQAALKDAAARTGQDPSTISVLRAESVDWSDSSLGCPQPGAAYLTVITPGWLIELRVGQATFEYHTDTRSRLILCTQR